MRTYLVGGAVRDKLLGIESFDKDFVVVESTPQEMLNLGFKQVGKDFPVFLHPTTKEEYALARVERKISGGYKGFAVDTKNVSLKDDLSRRDLTINSMAIDENGKIIDYFGGEEDLQLGILRHTSKAFTEDPVRILRLARFAAKFKQFGFKVAHSTFKLVKYMVESCEVDNLVSERVFLELQKTLKYNTPSPFFKTLATTGAYEKIFGVSINNNIHQNNFEFLDNSKEKQIKFALWCNIHSLDEIKTICKKLKAPKKYKDLATLSKKNLELAKEFNKNSAEKKLELFNNTDSIRQNARFNQLITIWQELKIDTQNIEKTNQKLTNIDVSKLDKLNIAQEIKTQRLKICKM